MAIREKRYKKRGKKLTLLFSALFRSVSRLSMLVYRAESAFFRSVSRVFWRVLSAAALATLEGNHLSAFYDFQYCPFQLQCAVWLKGLARRLAYPLAVLLVAMGQHRRCQHQYSLSLETTFAVLCLWRGASAAQTSVYCALPGAACIMQTERINILSQAHNFGTAAVDNICKKLHFIFFKILIFRSI